MRKYPTCSATAAAPMRPISFICVRMSDTITHNFLKSSCVHDPLNQLVIVENNQNLFYANLGAALNVGIAQAKHELIVLVREDVFLVDHWQSQFEASLRELETRQPNWKLLGSVGRRTGETCGHWSDPLHANPTNTFDERNFCKVTRLADFLIVLRRSGELRPDPALPGQYQLGVDLACQKGRGDGGIFAINAPTVHEYATAEGTLIQTRKDSARFKARKSHSFQADFAVTQSYIDHKHGLERLAPPVDPTGALSCEQQETLDAPLILLGRGGGGTRLISLIAQDCGLFIGNKVNASGDSLEMVPAIYRSVLRDLTCSDDWSKSVIEADLRAAAAAMLTTTQWPAKWGFKLPETTLILPFIRNAFPKARYLHFQRAPESTVFRRSHMTARFDNEIGRAAVPAAYDYLGLPRSRILEDTELLHMAATTRHQNDLIHDHLATLASDRYATISFEETIAAPADALARFAEFSHLSPQHHAILDAVNADRATSEISYDQSADRARVLEMLNCDL